METAAPGTALAATTMPSSASSASALDGVAEAAANERPATPRAPPPHTAAHAKLPPQDGLRACRVALGGFLAGLGVAGLLYSGGIFLPAIAAEFQVSPGSASLVMTLALAAFFAVGIFSVRWADNYGLRRVMAVGAVFWVAGNLLGSFATELWHSVLTQGVMSGIGTSLVYFPVIAILPPWFLKYRATAVGITVLGTSVGSVIFSIAGQAIINGLGWRNALRAATGIGAVLVTVAIALVERRGKPHHAGPFIGVVMKLVRLPSVQWFVLGSLAFQFSFFAPYNYLLTYCELIGLSPDFGAFATAMLGIGSSVGRLTFGPLSDLAGRALVFRLAVGGTAVALACWTACFSEPAILAFAFFFGACGGGFAATFAVVASDFWGPHSLVGLLPLVNVASIPGAFGSGPLFGVASTPNFVGGIWLSAAASLLSFLCHCMARKPTTGMAEFQDDVAAPAEYEQRAVTAHVDAGDVESRGGKPSDGETRAASSQSPRHRHHEAGWNPARDGDVAPFVGVQVVSVDALEDTDDVDGADDLREVDAGTEAKETGHQT